MARQGLKITVIAPLTLHMAWRGKDPFYKTELTGGCLDIDLFRPRFLSVSNKQIFLWNTALIGFQSFCRAVGRVLKDRIVPRPNALYGHFLYLGGAAATRFGVAMGIPSFTMVGEGQLCSVKSFGFDRARRHFSHTTGFMPNSSCLARLLVDQLGVSKEQIGVFPNGINHRVFFPRDKFAMRSALGLPHDRFLVICVGHQDLQKGPVRVGEAIAGLEGVNGVFLGSGPNPPVAENIIYNDQVPHERIPEWLSAADAFVLPSTYEGSCNAALEAMSCGLPIVASRGDFNDDILNDLVSIRVDPLDVSAIRSAIIYLRDYPERRMQMGCAALKWSAKFDTDLRTQRMLEFMSERINGESEKE